MLIVHTSPMTSFDDASVVQRRARVVAASAAAAAAAAAAAVQVGLACTYWPAAELDLDGYGDGGNDSESHVNTVRAEHVSNSLIHCWHACFFFALFLAPRAARTDAPPQFGSAGWLSAVH